MSRTKVSRLESLNVMLKIIDRINMKMDNLLAKGEFKFEDMKEEALNTNQRHAGLQHQAQQPRLAMKADVQEDKKTRKSTEDFAQDRRLGDISSDRVHDPMRLTSFGDQDCNEPPALHCRDDALVNQGHEVAKPCLSPEEIRKSTSAGSLIHASATCTTKTQGTNFSPQLLPWSFHETSEEKNNCTIQTFAKYNRSWRTQR